MTASELNAVRELIYMTREIAHAIASYPDARARHLLDHIYGVSRRDDAWDRLCRAIADAEKLKETAP